VGVDFFDISLEQRVSLTNVGPQTLPQVLII